MKKSLVKKIVVLFVVMIMASGAVFAADLVLSGTIDQNVSFSVTPVSGTADALELFASSATAVTDLKVADAVTISNAANGYKIESFSTYGGKLTSSNSDEVTYTAKLGTHTIALDTSAALIYSSTAITPSAGLAEDIVISYTKDNYPAGTYTDTITFTITAL